MSKPCGIPLIEILLMVEGGMGVTELQHKNAHERIRI